MKKKMHILTAMLVSFAVTALGDYVDDMQTLGLWHMDDAVLIEDDDSANPGRGDDLHGYGLTVITNAQHGNGLYFDGTTNAYANTRSPGGSWGGIEGKSSMRLEATFRVDTKSGTHWIVDIQDHMMLFTDTSAIKFAYKLSDGTWNGLIVYGVPNSNENPDSNPFITAVAEVNEYTGVASLQISGVSTGPTNGLVTAVITQGMGVRPDRQIELGADSSFYGDPRTDRLFHGVIDEVKISEIMPDGDIDGVPLAWILSYWDATNDYVAAADDDVDGMMNKDEYFADTVPDDPASVLKLLEVSAGDTETVIKYKNGGSAADVSVEYLAALSGDESWMPVMTNAAPSHTTNTWSHPVAGSSGFYRLRAGR